MKALKRLERMGEAIQEFRPILSLLLKEERMKADSAVKVTSNSTTNDSKGEEVVERVSQTKTPTEADLLIAEVSELLEKPTNRESIRKSGRETSEDSTLIGKEEARKPKERVTADPLVKDAEDKSDANPSRDFWFSLANQKIRI